MQRQVRRHGQRELTSIVPGSGANKTAWRFSNYSIAQGKSWAKSEIRTPVKHLLAHLTA